MAVNYERVATCGRIHWRAGDRWGIAKCLSHTPADSVEVTCADCPRAEQYAGGEVSVRALVVTVLGCQTKGHDVKVAGLDISAALRLLM